MFNSAVTSAHLHVARSQALVVLLLLRIKRHHELKCFPLEQPLSQSRRTTKVVMS